MGPKVFIGSSHENLDVAYAIQENIERDSEPTVWTNDIFALSHSTIDSLIDKLGGFDFSIFIFSPDDIGIINNQEKLIVRDNVVLELGLSIGRLGIKRTFIVAPRGQEKLHLPTDLLGITIATFDPIRVDENLSAALGPACNKIIKSIKKLGSIDCEHKEKREFPVLLETINCINKKDIELNFHKFKGYYFGYIYWIKWDESDKKLKAKSYVYRFLVKMDSIDEDFNVIKTELVTENSLKKAKMHDEMAKWTYHGIMIPISQKLYFVFEAKYEDPIDFVFIITNNIPKDHLRGVLTAESATPEQEAYKSLPASTRITLERISDDEIKQGEDYLISKVGYFQPDEIDQDIMEKINNNVKDELGILMTYSLECKLRGV